MATQHQALDDQPVGVDTEQGASGQEAVRSCGKKRITAADPLLDVLATSGTRPQLGGGGITGFWTPLLTWLQ